MCGSSRGVLTPNECVMSLPEALVLAWYRGKTQQEQETLRAQLSPGALLVLDRLMSRAA